jgi:hypothetical protein
VVGVDRDIGIVQVDGEAVTPLADVVRRFREATAWQEALRLEVFVDPLEEAFRHRLAMGLAPGTLACTAQVVLADMLGGVFL